ncbi:MAG: hypothetical protein V4850_20460 [Myxococcota bacterium]
MFTLIRPQLAQHDSGYFVTTRDRHSVLLMEADGSSVVAEAEYGPRDSVYTSTIVKHDAQGRTLAMSDAERDSAAERMAEGLRAMGATVDVYW